MLQQGVVLVLVGGILAALLLQQPLRTLIRRHTRERHAHLRLRYRTMLWIEVRMLRLRALVSPMATQLRARLETLGAAVAVGTVV
eukprot:COSAG01_NODE_6048_length_3880_cov_21.012431_4_plen_85_part_00